MGTPHGKAGWLYDDAAWPPAPAATPAPRLGREPWSRADKATVLALILASLLGGSMAGLGMAMHNPSLVVCGAAVTVGACIGGHQLLD